MTIKCRLPPNNSCKYYAFPYMFRYMISYTYCFIVSFLQTYEINIFYEMKLYPFACESRKIWTVMLLGKCVEDFHN